MWAHLKLPLVVAAGFLLLGAAPGDAHTDDPWKEVTLTTGLTFKWQLVDGNDGKEIEAEVVYAGDAWVAFGWNEDGQMEGTEAIIGKPDDRGAPGQYHLNGMQKSDVVWDIEQNLVSSSLVQSGGKTTLKFKRKLDTGDPADKVLTAGGETTCVYAYGKGNKFEKHVAKGSVNINLETGATSTSVSALKILHGASMTLAWGLLAQWGVGMVRFHPSRREGPPPDAGKVATWFALHRNLQAAAVGFALLGFVLAVVMVQGHDAPHFDGLHQVVGLVVTILAVLQPIGGLLRPAKKDAAGNVTTKRRAFEIGHRSLGALALLLGTANIIGGSLYLSGGLVALFPAITGVSLLCLGAYVFSKRPRSKELEL